MSVPERARPGSFRHQALKRLVALVCASWLSLPAVGLPGEVELQGQRFRIPDGYTIELAAAPPLVERPICADFDRLGRLYVAESSGSNVPVEQQLAQKPHRILRLEDSDGDGIFDRRTVFADRLMFPEGVLWHDGALYVAAPPQIWKFTDSNDDGVADERSVWFDGQTLTHCANDLHGPYLGPDGWLYWCKGAFAEQQYRIRGKTWHTRAAHVFRRSPLDRTVEPVITGGMDNPVEVAFTRTGEAIFTTTFLQHPRNGKRDGLIHAIYGGLYGKRHSVLDGHPRTGDLLPPLVHLGAAAPCGLAAVPSRVGERETFLACSFNMHKVTRHQLSRSGSAYEASTEDLLISDHVDFHPTDVLVDADTSILVIDTGGWYKLCCPTSHLYKPDILGAIYRLRKSNRSRVADPRGLLLRWRQMSNADLIARLDDPRCAVRRSALDELSRRGSAAVSDLRAALQAESPQVRLQSVWALTRIATPDAQQAIIGAMADSHAEVTHAALRAVATLRIQGASAAVRTALGCPDATLRRVAAEACGRMGDAKAVPELLSSASLTADRMEEHAIIYALIEIDAPDKTRQGLTASHPRTRIAAARALVAMPHGELAASEVIPWLHEDDPALQHAAISLISTQFAWQGAMATWLSSQLRDTSVPRETLARVVQACAAEPEVQRVIRAWLSETTAIDDDTDWIVAALDHSSLASLSPDWHPALEKLLAARSVPVVVRTVDWLRGCQLPGALARRLWPLLEATARRKDVPPLARLRALALSGEERPVLKRDLFDFALAALDSERPIGEQLAGVAVLRDGVLSPIQRRQLIRKLAVASPLALQQLIPAFARVRSPSEQALILDALQQNASRSAIPPGQLRTLFTNPTADSQRRIDQLIAEISPEPAKQKAHIEALLADLPPGDRRRGYAVFFGAKAACSTCHSIGYLGGNVGPDLTRIGQIRTARDLLESIVYPSASFVRSFEPVTIRTFDGRIVSGIVREERTDSLELVVAADRTETVAKDDIEAMVPSAASIMPAGLEKQLTRQELADLVEFLQNAR